MQNTKNKSNHIVSDIIDVPHIFVDTREKLPYVFYKTESCAGGISKTLPVGDYMVEGVDDLVIERKASVSELWSNFGVDRERFFRELELLRKFKYKFLILELQYKDILNGCAYSQISPNFIISNLLKVIFEYEINVIFAGNRTCAHDITRRILLKAWKYNQEGRLNGIKEAS